jgi:hypothetical protein
LINLQFDQQPQCSTKTRLHLMHPCTPLFLLPQSLEVLESRITGIAKSKWVMYGHFFVEVLARAEAHYQAQQAGQISMDEELFIDYNALPGWNSSSSEPGPAAAAGNVGGGGGAAAGAARAPAAAAAAAAGGNGGESSDDDWDLEDVAEQQQNRQQQQSNPGQWQQQQQQQWRPPDGQQQPAAAGLYQQYAYQGNMG